MLNQTIGIDAHEWQLEADPKHSEMIVKQLGFVGAQAVSNVGADEKEDEREAPTKLEGNDVRLLRRVAARCNDFSMDRSAVVFVAKGGCR